ncbi:MAG: HAD family hydrolase [Oscillospiraceae bacterium]|nr:HAD family hydrolase [Oscillospiraceae bacterium]
MAVKALLLDLDGTILDTLDDLCDSVNFALSAHGHPTRTNREIRAIVGNGVINLITRSLPEGVSEKEFEECLATYKEHYEINKTNKTAPYDGIPEALALLRDNGYKLAIVSNKHDEAVQGLYNLFFKELADFAIGNTAEIPKKPEPDMVFAAAKKLGVPLNEIVFVGDSEVDLQTARNAGVPCISVTWGFRDADVLIDAGADSIIHSPNELYEAVKNM